MKFPENIQPLCLLTNQNIRVCQNQTSSDLPNDILLEIFKFLSVRDLNSVSLTCKRWHQLSSYESLWKSFNLKELFPSLTIFDLEDWKTHFNLPNLKIDINAAPSSDYRIMIAMLQKLFSYPLLKNTKVTLLTIPAGLTYNKCIKLAESLHSKGHKILINSFHKGYIFSRKNKNYNNFIKHTNKPVAETYRVILTEVLKDSKNAPISSLQKLVKEMNCEVPDLLASTVLPIVTHAASPNKIYKTGYTVCQETFENRKFLVKKKYLFWVGHTSSNQLCVKVMPKGKDKNLGVRAMFKVPKKSQIKI